MPIPTAEQAATGSSGEEHIDSLLGADLQDTASETDAGAAEDTSVVGTDVAVEEELQQVEEGEPTEGEAEGTDDAAEGEAEGAEEEAGEEDFDLGELETDFAESAYAKAAEHYFNRTGKRLDPNDKGDRWLLHELMDRGQKIKELQSRQTEEADKETKEQPTETQVAQNTKTPQELMQARLAGAKQYAKESVVPEVAMDFAKAFVDSLWPGKDVKVSQEQANALTQTFTAFGAMLVGDAIPSILSATPAEIARAYPMLSRVHSMAEREAAVEELTGATDKATGAALYPGIDKLIENGTIKRIVDTELKDAVFNSKDPFKNMVAKMTTAYKMASRQGVDPKVVQKAVERGRQQAKDRAARVGAGRVPPGSSRSASAGAGKGSFVQSLVENSGSKFSRMLKEAGK